MSEATRLTKRRKVMPQHTFELETTLQLPSTSMLSTISLPTQLALTDTPQDLVYSVLTGNKAFYTKQEVLLLMDKLTKMISPRFEGDPPSYIS